MEMGAGQSGPVASTACPPPRPACSYRRGAREIGGRQACWGWSGPHRGTTGHSRSGSSGDSWIPHGRCLRMQLKVLLVATPHAHTHMAASLVLRPAIGVRQEGAGTCARCRCWRWRVLRWFHPGCTAALASATESSLLWHCALSKAWEARERNGTGRCNQERQFVSWSPAEGARCRRCFGAGL